MASEEQQVPEILKENIETAQNSTATRDELARDRTHLANERTLLAYWRTALALIGLAIFVLRFSHWPLSALLGIPPGAMGLLLAVLGTRRFVRYKEQIHKR